MTQNNAKRKIGAKKRKIWTKKRKITEILTLVRGLKTQNEFMNEIPITLHLSFHYM